MWLVLKVFGYRHGVQPIPQRLTYPDAWPDMSVREHRVGMQVHNQRLKTFNIRKLNGSPFNDISVCIGFSMRAEIS
jgi:hypothetical protein